MYTIFLAYVALYTNASSVFLRFGIIFSAVFSESWLDMENGGLWMLYRVEHEKLNRKKESLLAGLEFFHSFDTDHE